MNSRRSVFSWIVGAGGLFALIALVLAGLQAAQGGGQAPAAYPGPEASATEELAAYPPPQESPPGPLAPSAPPPTEAAVVPSATHDPPMPTLIPPDRTLEAEAAAIPPCCDDSNLVIRTPSLTQVAVWTESAQSLYPPTLQPGVPSTTPYPMGEFLPPSGAWASHTYTDSVYSYSFEYPANWFTELDGNQTYVHNLSPGLAPKNQLDPHRIKIIVSPQEDGLEQYSSLEAYLSDPKHAVPADELLSQQAPEALVSGYQAIRQEQTAFMSDGGIVVRYVTDGRVVYSVTVFSRNSLYIGVVDHLINTLVIH